MRKYRLNLLWERERSRLKAGQRKRERKSERERGNENMIVRKGESY